MSQKDQISPHVDMGSVFEIENVNFPQGTTNERDGNTAFIYNEQRNKRWRAYYLMDGTHTHTLDLEVLCDRTWLTLMGVVRSEDSTTVFVEVLTGNDTTTRGMVYSTRSGEKIYDGACDGISGNMSRNQIEQLLKAYQALAITAFSNYC